MIELRIVEHELGVKPEIQYRYQVLRSPTRADDWSEWQTADWITAADAEYLNSSYPTGLVGDPQ